MWATSTSYTNVPPASLVINGAALFVCIVPHVSGGSFDSTKWQQVFAFTSQNYQAPATGATITLGGSDTDLIIDPAGTIATLTVTLFGSPYDGQRIRFYNSQTITALTINSAGGKSVKGAPTTLSATTSGAEGVFRATNNTWYF